MDTWQHEVELSLDDDAVVDSVYALLDLTPADARPGVNETLLEAAYEWRRQKVGPPQFSDSPMRVLAHSRRPLALHQHP